MSAVLVLDTNVLSELMRPRPASSVLLWMNAQSSDEIFTTAVSEAELLVGIALLPAGRRRDDLRAAATRVFARFAPSQILAFDSASAAQFARLFAARRGAGRPLQPMDAQIAGIVAANNATLVTRDVADFAECGFSVLDPWSA